MFFNVSTATNTYLFVFSNRLICMEILSLKETIPFTTGYEEMKCATFLLEDTPYYLSKFITVSEGYSIDIQSEIYTVDSNKSKANVRTVYKDSNNWSEEQLFSWWHETHYNPIQDISNFKISK